MITLSVISADSKKKETDLLRAEEEARQEAYEALRGQRVTHLVELLFNEAKTTIEKTKNYYSCEVMITEEKYVQWGKPDLYELKDAADIVRALLIKSGYKVNEWHEYSPAWRTRSGRIGYLYVSWYGD